MPSGARHKQTGAGCQTRYGRHVAANASTRAAAEIRDTVAAARQRMARLYEGGSGAEACAELSDAYDGVLRTLWQEASAAAPGVPMALVATGGWGRRELCPYSDIDFILLAGKRDGDKAKAVADRLLYPMWDAGVEIGHAVRDPGGAARLARDDLATATALLDLRRVAGDQGLVTELRIATRKSIAPGGNPN